MKIESVKKKSERKVWKLDLFPGTKILGKGNTYKGERA